MKKFFIFIMPFFFIQTASAQNTEYSLHFNSGLFSFGGKHATENSLIVISDVANIDNYTNNPYGSKNALSYGLALEVHRVTKANILFGIEAGYEILRSNEHIKSITGELAGPPPQASGHTILRNEFINLYPNIGYRFGLQKLDIDLVAGPEFGLNTGSNENGEATTRGTEIKTDHDRHNPGTDVRLRASLTVYHTHWGISVGYSYGLHNYTADVVGGNPKTYARFIRFGIAYRL